MHNKKLPIVQLIRVGFSNLYVTVLSAAEGSFSRNDSRKFYKTINSMRKKTAPALGPILRVEWREVSRF